MWLMIDNGKSEIQIPFEDSGTIWHEQAHDLFHHSPVHDGSHNETWGEGFCEAIRYLMEQKYNKDSHWLRAIWRGKDWRIQRAKQILSHCGNNLPTFAKGWQSLVQEYDNTPDFLQRRTIV